MLHNLIVAFCSGALAAAVGFGGGWYCHWRYGSRVKAEVEKIATELSTFGNKPSGK